MEFVQWKRLSFLWKKIKFRETWRALLLRHEDEESFREWWRGFHIKFSLEVSDNIPPLPLDMWAGHSAGWLQLWKWNFGFDFKYFLSYNSKIQAFCPGSDTLTGMTCTERNFPALERPVWTPVLPTGSQLTGGHSSQRSNFPLWHPNPVETSPEVLSVLLVSWQIHHRALYQSNLGVVMFHENSCLLLRFSTALGIQAFTLRCISTVSVTLKPLGVEKEISSFQCKICPWIPQFWP